MVPTTAAATDIELYASLVKEADNVYKDDLWSFVCEQVRTIDEASGTVTAAPQFDYLQKLFRFIEDHDLIVIPKSRRMFVTWALAIWSMWRCRYRRAQAVFMQSENEEKAAYIVGKRSVFVEENLDREFRRDFIKIKTTKGEVGRMIYKGTGSYIHAIPQGADAVRAYTMSALISDEIDSQAEGHLGLVAALPLAEKGAKIILVTTSKGPSGPVARICRDTGFIKWNPDKHAGRTAQGYWIFPVHYTMDPSKTAEWAEAKMAAYPSPRAWDLEMEMDFGMIAGTPAYPSFRAEVHLAKSRLETDPRLPIRLCCDFNVGMMFWNVVQFDPQVRDSIRVVDSIDIRDRATIDQMVQQFRLRYPDHPAGVIVYGDASGRAKSSQTGKSDYELMQLAFGNYPTSFEIRVPRTNPPVKDRLNAVNRVLIGRGDAPRVTIDSVAAPELVADLEQVRMNKSGMGIMKSSDPNDPYYYRTHSSDGFGYFITVEFPVVNEYLEEITKGPRPPLKYGRVLGDL